MDGHDTPAGQQPPVQQAAPDAAPGGVVETPHAAAEPPGTGGWGLLRLALVAVALVALGAGAATAGMRLTSQARDERAVRSAEERYDAAIAAVEAVQTVFEATELVSDQPVGPKLASVAASATVDLDRARAELDAAERAIGRARPGAARDTYARSLDEARLGVEGLGEMLAETGRVGALIDRVASARTAGSEGQREVNEAIQLVNAGKWRASERKAKAAEESFRDAEAAYRSAHGSEPESGFDEAVAYVVKEREEAALVTRMARLGGAGKVSEYNDLVTRSEKLREELLRMRPPSDVADAGWAEDRLAGLGDEAIAHLRRADDLRAEALEGFFGKR
ncbi:MAG: hypothetical protein IBX62_02330 [Coriobacteriia bacterium]|nr:hypothetical protein [Coriobacteriia bacterium]